MPSHVAYALQESITQELEKTARAPSTGNTGSRAVAERRNRFVVVPKPSVTMCMCLIPIEINQAPVRLVHRVLTINEILPKLTNMHYLTIVDVSRGYHRNVTR